MNALAMAELHARCFDEAPRPWTRAEFAAALYDPRKLVVREAAGFAVVGLAGDEAELLTLAVAPEARRQGVGARLLGAALVEAAARGAARMLLEVDETNAPARALYALAGFEAVGARPRYYRRSDGRATDAVVMARDLG